MRRGFSMLDFLRRIQAQRAPILSRAPIETRTRTLAEVRANRERRKRLKRWKQQDHRRARGIS